MRTNTLVLHGCGGCGINQVAASTSVLKELGDGFADIIDTYIDTTDKNFKHLEDVNNDSCYSISDNSYKGNALDGAGGERRTNYKFIQESVKDYLDKRGIKEHDNGTYHAVVFSAGGGSGSVIGPVLLKNMLERGIPAIAIITGDMETGNLAQNTSNSLATLQSMAKLVNKPISLYYVNNKTSKGNSIAEREATADKNVLSFLTSLSIFVSGHNFSLDNQDMNNLFDFTSIKSIKLPVGVFVINVFSGKVNLKDGTDAFIGRTLTKEEVSPDTGIELVHWKAGKIVNENALELAGNSLPLHMVLTTGMLFNEDKVLKTRIKELRETVDNIAPDQLEIDSEAEENEDGLVL
jgi:hypothetical protein